MLKKNTKGVIFLSIFILTIILSRLVLRSTGDAHPSPFNILALSIIISFLLGSMRYYYLISLPLSILFFIYAPVGFSFGPPSYQYVASLFATDGGEAFEFLSLISAKYYFYAFLIPALFFLISFLSCKLKIKPVRNRFYVITSLIFLFLLSNSVSFFGKTKDSILSVKKEMDELSKYANRNDWTGISQTNRTKYDDYILVIGESARRDYFNAYGYPVKNTPFIQSVNGVVVNGLESAGNYTIGSLRLMLTQGDKSKRQPNYNLNVVGMASKAGFETYWISNQGQFGRWDSPISSIAKSSDHTYFTKSGEYNKKNISDFVLIDKLKSVVSENTGKKRFIVLHTMGSHPSACDRVYGMTDTYHVNNHKYSYIACYVSSIKMTDDFLKDVYSTLRNNDHNRRFSIVYFSDHGLSHKDVSGVIQMNNSYIGKYHYNVPLVRISSDDTTHREFKSQKSGVMFLNGIADWMGIYGDSIEQYNLFDGVNQNNNYGLKIHNESDDPAIDISSDLIIHR
ncbi:phosphoethanolamine transferase [Enterobacter hormaechei]